MTRAASFLPAWKTVRFVVLAIASVPGLGAATNSPVGSEGPANARVLAAEPSELETNSPPVRTTSTADIAMPSTTAPVGGANTKAVGGGNSPEATARGATRGEGDTKIDFPAFQMISERNIFNPNRSPRLARGAGGEARKAARIETFKLVGTMTYDQGDLAFFDGSSPAYRKAVRTNETIGVYRVAAITADEVTLSAEGRTVTARIGTRFGREDDGPWTVAAAGSVLASTETAGETAAGGLAESTGEAAPEVVGNGSGGAASDVLKRLRQKREQETKNEKP